MTLRHSSLGKRAKELDWGEERVLIKRAIDKTRRHRPSSSGNIIGPGASKEPALSVKEAKQMPTDRTIKKMLLSLSVGFKTTLLFEFDSKLGGKLQVFSLP